MSELSAFARALATRREQVVARMMEACAEHLPEVIARVPETFRQRVSNDVDAQIAAIEDPEARTLREATRRWCTEALERGLPPDKLLRLIDAARGVLFDTGLSLHEEGVPHALAGIRRLMAVQSEMVCTFDALFRERTERTHAQARVFEELVRHAPYGIGIADEGGIMMYTNPAYRQLMGAAGEPLEGRPVPSLLTEESRVRLRDEVVAVLMRGRTWTGILDHERADGSLVPAQSTTFIMKDAQGHLLKCAIVRDLSETRRAEERRRALHEALITAQEAALRELGTPLVPIADGVLAMPLVGTIDEARAERMLDTLLEGITREGARVAILDITGVRHVDASAAGALLAAARAVRLLGAEVVLTGIQPAVAQALVENDADLGSIATRSTLAEGLKFALSRARR